MTRHAFTFHGADQHELLCRSEPGRRPVAAGNGLQRLVGARVRDAGARLQWSKQSVADVVGGQTGDFYLLLGVKDPVSVQQAKPAPSRSAANLHSAAFGRAETSRAMAALNARTGTTSAGR